MKAIYYHGSSVACGKRPREKSVTQWTRGSAGESAWHRARQADTHTPVSHGMSKVSQALSFEPNTLTF